MQKFKKTMKIAKSSKMNLVFKLEHYYFLCFEFAGKVYAWNYDKEFKWKQMNYYRIKQ